MANEQQYYNPIIQAMAQSVQAQQNQQKLEQEQERQKQAIASSKLSDAARQHQLDLEEKRLENEHEFQQNTLGLHHEMQAAQLKQMQLNDLLTKRNLSMGGVDIGAALKAGAAPDAGVPNPQEALAAEAQKVQTLAGAHTTGTMTAAAPFQQQIDERKHHFDTENRLLDHANRMELSTQQGQNAIEAAKVHGSYQQSVAAINGANHFRGIALMHQLGMDDGSGSGASQARDLVDGLYNGNIEYSKLSADQKRAVSAYATANGEMSGLPTDTKAYKVKLDMLTKFQTYIDQFRDMANNYSADTKGATGKGNVNINLGPLGTHGFVAPGTDLASKIADIKTIGGDLAKNLEGQSRTAEADNLRQVVGKFDPLATKAQNLQKLQDVTTRMQPIVKNTLGGMTADRQNKILGDRGITDFGSFKPKQFVNRANGHVIEESPDGKQWIDSQTKQPFQQNLPPVQ